MDLTLIVENDTFALPERCKLMCIGTLEENDEMSETSEGSLHKLQSVHARRMRGRSRQVAPETRFVLLAIWAKTTNELDLRLWVRAAREMRRSLLPSAS